MNRPGRHVAVSMCAAAVLFGPWVAVRLQAPVWPRRLSDKQFWEIVVTFSEAEGVFRASGGYRSDNLVSNERSLQDVMPELQKTKRSGAYVGVGPEQNLTYIAALQPTMAFIIDIRRQNMLLHLLYKALLETSADRVEFLSRLFARRPAVGIARNSSAQALFDAFKAVPYSPEIAQVNIQAVLNRLERVHGFSLRHEDEATIKDLYHSFYIGGPNIRWDPEGGSWMPTYAELMAQTDPQGIAYSYLASEENFQLIKQYETNNRIVPLVGNFGGGKAIRSVASYLKQHHAVMATFYVSNVEAYLAGDNLTRFISNVSTLPLDEHSMFIRTAFHTTRNAQTRPDYQTATATYSIKEWLDSWSSVSLKK